MSQSSLGGVFPVLPTIFDDHGEIDRDGMRSVVDYVVASGADGLVFPGLASEYDLLTLDEREDLIGLIGDAVAGRVRFVVGASSDQVGDSARLAAAGAAAGASAAMVMTPRALGPDVDALSRFYQDLGAQAGLPIMLQNAPTPMGLGLAADAVARIVAASDAVRWVKEENMPCGQRISALLASDVPHLTGVFGGAGGRYITDELARGAIGSMPAAETPEVHVALMRAHLAGDRAEVWRLYEALLPILMIQAVYRWRLTKEVLRRRSVIASAYTRAAGPEFDETDQLELGTVLDRLQDAYAAR
ncbi:dihydrodipicolinate synthase family protein [Sphingomonas pruni]|uniref:dihydrodipicolinate synthase family protein n=1 Tax=Sphingomonas pruni TaxID=40683 RepID=UPI00082DAA19|nr:dihydrodipicolinate synthase family protein [Sphingomonas pruni]